jgi:hypothetical protein
MFVHIATIEEQLLEGAGPPFPDSFVASNLASIALATNRILQD